MMCSQGLWRLVRTWNQPTEQVQPHAPAHLTDWAAATLKDDGDTLVLALEVQTYLHSSSCMEMAPSFRTASRAH